MLATIHVPTLIVVGDEDALTPPALSEEMHRAIAGSELVIIPGAGHLSNLEQPRAVQRRARALPRASGIVGRTAMRRGWDIGLPLRPADRWTLHPRRRAVQPSPRRGAGPVPVPRQPRSISCSTLYVRDGFVYYRALKTDRAQARRLRQLSWRRRRVASCSRDEQMAFWLNAYNALVLRTVIDHYPIQGRSRGVSGEEHPADSRRVRAACRTAWPAER